MLQCQWLMKRAYFKIAHSCGRMLRNDTWRFNRCINIQSIFFSIFCAKVMCVSVPAHVGLFWVFLRSLKCGNPAPANRPSGCPESDQIGSQPWVTFVMVCYAGRLKLLRESSPQKLAMSEAPVLFLHVQSSKAWQDPLSELAAALTCTLIQWLMLDDQLIWN